MHGLYQEVILDHCKHPSNQKLPDNPSHKAKKYNHLCGDEIVLELCIDNNNKISAIGFHASGCAISIASASIMSGIVKDKSTEEVYILIRNFRDLVTGKGKESPDLGKLVVFAGVAKYPMRVKCSLLAWDALQTALR